MVGFSCTSSGHLEKSFGGSCPPPRTASVLGRSTKGSKLMSMSLPQLGPGATWWKEALPVTRKPLIRLHVYLLCSSDGYQMAMLILLSHLLRPGLPVKGTFLFPLVSWTVEIMWGHSRQSLRGSSRHCRRESAGSVVQKPFERAEGYLSRPICGTRQRCGPTGRGPSPITCSVGVQSRPAAVLIRYQGTRRAIGKQQLRIHSDRTAGPAASRSTLTSRLRLHFP
ncbi:hypothetical protein QBC37DRAFT_68585 [Rhypophila decipiens]|uniref:Uncharacterized protein n=1 Tax=Rhypophila decipiens TaxID=261697 RepID=A0AAN6YEI5_9PEZI|nr:hypothetical protein QBC37DRAFT_68585 [Rhypophila decipiens]